MAPTLPHSHTPIFTDEKRTVFISIHSLCKLYAQISVGIMWESCVKIPTKVGAYPLHPSQKAFSYATRHTAEWFFRSVLSWCTPYPSVYRSDDWT